MSKINTLFRVTWLRSRQLIKNTHTKFTDSFQRCKLRKAQNHKYRTNKKLQWSGTDRSISQAVSLSKSLCYDQAATINIDSTPKLQSNYYVLCRRLHQPLLVQQHYWHCVRIFSGVLKPHFVKLKRLLCSTVTWSRWSHMYMDHLFCSTNHLSRSHK